MDRQLAVARALALRTFVVYSANSPKDRGGGTKA